MHRAATRGKQSPLKTLACRRPTAINHRMEVRIAMISKVGMDTTGNRLHDNLRSLGGTRTTAVTRMLRPARRPSALRRTRTRRLCRMGVTSPADTMLELLNTVAATAPTTMAAADTERMRATLAEATATTATTTAALRETTTNLQLRKRMAWIRGQAHLRVVFLRKRLAPACGAARGIRRRTLRSATSYLATTRPDYRVTTAQRCLWVSR
jgi:hypothetical protein